MEPPLARAGDDWLRTTELPDTVACRRPVRLNTMPAVGRERAGTTLRFLDPLNAERGVVLKRGRGLLDAGWISTWVGSEHAVLHLLYARFWHKVLYDLGVVSTKEPFQKLFNQGIGLVCGRTRTRAVRSCRSTWPRSATEKFFHKETGAELERIVAKMSKALKNVENPDDIVREWGRRHDAPLRDVHGPLEASTPWNPDDLPGVHRFLARAWRVFVPEGEIGEVAVVHPHLLKDHDPDQELEKALHKAIAKVTDDLERMQFNTAISAMMVFVNEATQARRQAQPLPSRTLRQAPRPLRPPPRRRALAPPRPRHEHRARGLARARPADAGRSRGRARGQVLGKMRAKIVVPADADKNAILSSAKEAVAEQLAGKTIVKEIVVPGRLVNFVAK